MAEIAIDPLQLNADFTTQQYQTQVIGFPTVTNIAGDVTIITTINGGGGGQATGPAITITSSWPGVNFTASAGTITLAINNATTARAALSAAKSGVNTDITELNGASQVDVSGEYKVDGTQVLTNQQPAIADATGAGDIVAQFNTLLAELRVHGIIAT